MATPAQIAANRRNSKLSSGPRRTDATRFNGLKHGLCAEQVVLPGEDPAAFEAEKRAWIDDWKPRSHTRAVLVERAAVASWKLRRATRAEAVRLYEAGADAAHEFDLSQRERVEGAVSLLRYEPGTALARLTCDPAGLDRLIGLWKGLADAASEPAGWHSRADHHDRLLNLLGHPSGSDPQGPEVVRTSLRLLAAPDPAAATGLRAFCLGRAEEVRHERSKFWDPSVLRRRAIDLACAPTSKEAQLLHRYEREHEKSLYAAIRGLLALEKSGADLPEEPGPPAEPRAEAVAAPTGPDKSITKHNATGTCDELASVGAAAPSGARPVRPAGRPGGTTGADPGPRKAPNRR